MEILEKFHLFVGSDEYCNVKQYIEKHNLQNELNNIIQENDKDKLFDFAFRYGLVSIVKFLYEELNVSYETTLFNNHILQAPPIKDDLVSNNVLAETGSKNERLQITISDKYENGRTECIQYLLKMRRYSKYYCKDKKFWFSYKKEIYD